MEQFITVNIKGIWQEQMKNKKSIGIAGILAALTLSSSAVAQENHELDRLLRSVSFVSEIKKWAMKEDRRIRRDWI